MAASTKRPRGKQEPVLSRLRGALRAVPKAQLLQVNLDVAQAVAIINQSLPRLRELEPRMAAELPAFDRSLLDKLPDYAHALSQSHELYRAAGEPLPVPPELFKKAKRLRSLLLTDVAALAGHGLVEGGLGERASAANGYVNVSKDLELLARALKKAWPRIEGRSPLTLGDLDDALEVSRRLLELAKPEQALADRAEACDLRARAFTLTMRAYREVRRAVAYLREPEGDADVFAPRLHQGRPR